MSILVVLNPAARGGRIRRLEKPLREAMLERLGPAEWFVPGSASETVGRVAAATAVDTVIAVGGDGSVNTVLQGIAAGGFAARFAVVPAGTGNDFAFALGMPASALRAIEVLAAGTERRVDVGMVRLDGSAEMPFVNAVGVGFDASASVNSREWLFLPGAARYLASALQTLRGWTSPTAMIEVDGHHTSRSVMFMTIGNGSRSGGAFLITPDAQIDDGQFDVCLSDHVGTLRALTLLPAVLRGKHLPAPEVTVLRGAVVRFEAESGVAVHADGEILHTHAHLVEARLLPGALRVLGPPPARSSAPPRSGRKSRAESPSG